MVRNCRWFSNVAMRSTLRAIGMYSPSRIRSRLYFSIRAGPVSPGGGIVTRSWLRNATLRSPI